MKHLLYMLKKCIYRCFLFSYISFMKNLTKLYFILVSLVGVIWLAIGYGVAGYSFFMSKYITNDEYMVKNYYEIDTCNQPDYSKTSWPDAKPVEKTDVEKQKCKDEATTRVLLRRSIDTKESVIGWLIRWSIALVLFLFHYPVMIKKWQEEKII